MVEELSEGLGPDIVGLAGRDHSAGEQMMAERGEDTAPVGDAG